MALETRGLATYINDIHYGDNLVPRKEIFDYGIAHHPPCLKHGRINRILVYPGCFNPPHRGHFELLCHGFKSGHDMNIIAAIILPLDDESLVEKLKSRDQENTIIFKKTERVRLWQGYVPSDWYWTYDRSVSEWYGFQKRLTQAAAKDGFNVRWAVLCGPDYVTVNEVPPIPAWGCKDIIVSNAGRPANFVSPTTSSLKTLKGCQAWEGITLDLEALQRCARESASWVISGIFMMAPKCAQRMLDEDPECIERMVCQLFDDAVEEGEAIKICRRRDDPEGTIRFVPMKSSKTEISSTRVREVIKRGLSKKQLINELQQLVLYPEILLGLISWKCPHKDCVTQVVLDI